MKISLTDLDLFLDELRHRGPNVEPVVRVRHDSAYQSYTTTYYLAATYARQYGEKVATVELLYRIGMWTFSPRGTRLSTMEEVERRQQLYRDAEALWTRNYDEALAKIAAVAGEIGVGVAGGEVAA